MVLPAGIRQAPRFHERAVHALLAGLNARMPFVMPRLGNDFEPASPPAACADEPAYDPDVHTLLKGGTSVTVRRLGDDLEAIPVEAVEPVVDARGSRVALSEPFSFLSPEGVRTMRSILQHATPPTRSYRSAQMRGLYLQSPFVRALLNCPRVMGHFSRLVGEPVIFHGLLHDAAFVNVGLPADPEQVVEGSVDPWHFDSCTYVAITLLSDPTDMVGGELQALKASSRDAALDKLAAARGRPQPADVHTVPFRGAGECAVLNGSEVLHRVTAVRTAREPRLSLGIGLQPANPFRADKTSLAVFSKYDGRESAAHEYFQMKAQMMGYGLMELARLTPAGRAGSDGGAALRAIAEELARCADVLDGNLNDDVGFVDPAGMEDDGARGAWS